MPALSERAATKASSGSAGQPAPSHMVVLRHLPPKAQGPTLALVGKGITFDSGGISLKPGDRSGR